jgi:hypothetical protein
VPVLLVLLLLFFASPQVLAFAVAGASVPPPLVLAFGIAGA